MKLFLGEIEEQTAFLNKEESHHLCKVMRLKIGDSIAVTNGLGVLAKGIITDNSDKKTTISITEKWFDFEKKKYRLHIAIAPTKNIDRLEFFLEKATEIGIDEITPIVCQNSERQKINPERLEKIILAATKQSLKAYLPKLNPAISFADFMQQKNDSQCFIAHCREDEHKILLDKNTVLENNICLLIGPEGDFTKEEIAKAETKNYKSISLGTQRMRTETAALYAVFTINLLKK